MRMTVVGSRGRLPGPGQPCSGYLVQEHESHVLLDCGPGVFGALSADPALLRSIDAILISHLHLDHCYDLLPLGWQLMLDQRANPDLPRLPLYVPPGATATLRALNSVFPVDPVPVLNRVFEDLYEVIEYAVPSSWRVGSLEVQAIAMEHSIPCAGFRLKGSDGSIAYTGDTEKCPQVQTLAEGVDLFLCEASLLESGHVGSGHLSAAEAGCIAEDAQVGQLCLTHLLSSERDWVDRLRDAATASYSGPVSIAQPGLRIEWP